MDGSPDGEEIAYAIQKLQTVWVGLPLGMKGEHLKTWLRGATREKDPATEKWYKLASITKIAFRNEHILEELAWTTMVLIPKSGGEYICIGLVKVIWKVCASIVNNKLQSTITLHAALHGFIRIRGTGTAIMEANL